MLLESCKQRKEEYSVNVREEVLDFLLFYNV